MIFSVRHITKFRYQPAIRESVMEVRMQPRSEGSQRCLAFSLDVAPNANVMEYRDYSGNHVHHFDIPGSHADVVVKAVALVEVEDVDHLGSSVCGSWAELEAQVETGDHWEMLLPSHFAHSTEELARLASELPMQRDCDPLMFVTRLNEGLYNALAYVPNSTQVDSPIDDALRSRQGVCQDFAHIMIALLRQVGMPCRYVSGYLFHASEAQDRSSDGASHAWVETFLPGMGWVAFDPTNSLVGSARHISVAIGRDYADVPPNRGVHKGEAQSALSVAVTVAEANHPLPEELPLAPMLQPRSVRATNLMAQHHEQQQQQQQQQQQ